MEADDTSQSGVNREIYDRLGDRWYTAKDDPVALLRAENRCRNPWISEELAKKFAGHPCRVLDVGCGAGFLANDLARRGHAVVGLDSSAEALSVAAAHDETRSVVWKHNDADPLPFDANSFEVVCAMDFLEHVPRPEAIVREVARVLAPGGLFFFHTFNRSLRAWLVVIKGVEWFVRNTPANLHVLSLFIRPDELRSMCQKHGLLVETLRGYNPKVWSLAFLRMLATGEVGDDFEFDFSRSTSLGYVGVARTSA
jgi:2-polyprenyl-6-hydroxyphenyl methylase/3-demethylubiquinone-9 3-methyltransferase